VFRRLTKFLKEVRVEIGKVTWPSRDELIGSTWVVIIISVAFAIFVWLIDLSLSRILDLVMR